MLLLAGSGPQTRFRSKPTINSASMFTVLLTCMRGRDRQVICCATQDVWTSC
jgi:hypothetical protein